ncbi:hypothetical protein CTI12_AA169430 [Artemisia annua]|uniref:Uncharacterized protein n=1 Tax=Artemisia annua TaxID=35608 RepID=A0A2U1PCA6_ARTAN|nr:hypothetical protein CTI12_AA169430 [Artemisia annua]
MACYTSTSPGFSSLASAQNMLTNQQAHHSGGSPFMPNHNQQQQGVRLWQQVHTRGSVWGSSRFTAGGPFSGVQFPLPGGSQQVQSHLTGGSHPVTNHLNGSQQVKLLIDVHRGCS